MIPGAFFLLCVLAGLAFGAYLIFRWVCRDLVHRE